VAWTQGDGFKFVKLPYGSSDTVLTSTRLLFYNLDEFSDQQRSKLYLLLLMINDTDSSVFSATFLPLFSSSGAPMTSVSTPAAVKPMKVLPYVVYAGNDDVPDVVFDADILNVKVSALKHKELITTEKTYTDQGIYVIYSPSNNAKITIKKGDKQLVVNAAKKGLGPGDVGISNIDGHDITNASPLYVIFNAPVVTADSVDVTPGSSAFVVVYS